MKTSLNFTKYNAILHCEYEIQLTGRRVKDILLDKN